MGELTAKAAAGIYLLVVSILLHAKMKEDVRRCVEHLLETNDIRRTFWHMDEKVEDLLYGIQQGDDSVIVGDWVVNMEGPYPMKTGRKTGLIHTCSDIVIMGGKPLFALNAMQVDSMQEAKEVAEDLKKQSNGLGVPIIGGNTQLENDLKPCISFVVFGQLLGEPISDAGARPGDRIFMLGEVHEGEVGERVHRATTKFATYMEMVERKVEIHSSKDASRGGWFGNMMEMLIKSKKGVNITSIPYPKISRYMGTYLLVTPEKEKSKMVEIAARHRCPIVEFGTITEKQEITLGEDVYVEEEKMHELIREFPYKKAKIRREPK